MDEKRERRTSAYWRILWIHLVARLLLELVGWLWRKVFELDPTDMF